MVREPPSPWSPRLSPCGEQASARWGRNGFNARQLTVPDPELSQHRSGQADLGVAELGSELAVQDTGEGARALSHI